MITNLDPEKITRLLTIGTRQLDQRTLSALSSARQTALSRQLAHAPGFVFNTGHGIHRLTSNPIRLWAIAGLLIAAIVIGMGYWHHMQEQQIDETDLAILTDDMPIDVFVN
jgi:hypothetical protein